MSNPIDSQSLFLDMLDQAEKEVGFVVKDCKVMIEALAMSNGYFVLTVTKILPNAKENTKRKVKVKKKSIGNIDNNKCAIFEFLSFDDFCDYGNSLTDSLYQNIANNIGISKLYYYKNKYYLIIEKLSDNKEFTRTFCSHLLEFGKFVSDSHTYENKIIECGKVLIKKHAILSCSNKFKKQTKKYTS